MKFGRVTNPDLVDFTLPQDHCGTKTILARVRVEAPLSIHIGCAKWNKSDLKGFYPKGVKDELKHYANNFNAVEMNSTFYGVPAPQQILNWKAKTSSTFRFFPKIPRVISHDKRLINSDIEVAQFVKTISYFGDRLGMVFLQLNENFNPINYSDLERFIQRWPKEIPLAVELRNSDWYSDGMIFDSVYQLFEAYKVVNILVDTAGRRDLLHMRLSQPIAFVRYVGANVDSDYTRLDAWVERIRLWKEQGLQRLYFFVHQNIEEASPLLSAYFIEKLNKELGTELRVPAMASYIPTLF